MVLDANVPPEDLACAKYCRSGMTSLAVDLQRKFEDCYNMPILLSYGATEFGGVVVQMGMDDVAKWGQTKIGSTGRAFGSAKVRVTDVETREVLPPGKEGLLEILVPSIKPDWVRTSDIAKIDQDDFVYILGRSDGAIMRGGFKILPETVESALLLHPNVEAAAVVGVEDSRLGQLPGALIELKKGAPETSAAELEAHVRGHVPATHVPAIWRFIDKIPRTASLKIARADVRDLLQAEGR
jgi:acyl-coenzyme A synthetase/AMP-(fatty) acid ligase